MAKFASGILEENESPFDTKVLLTQGGILDFFPKQKRRSHATADAFRRNFVPKVSEMTFLLHKVEGNLF